MDFSSKKIVIFSHYATTGACEELRDWLISQKARDLTYVAFPFGSNKNTYIQVDSYSDGQLVNQKRSFFKVRLPEALAYIKDFLYAVFYTLKYARKADVLVCGDNLLALASSLARPLASVKNVVYYMIDYTPVRYENKIMNAVYKCVDRLAAYSVDRVWPLTKEMIEARFDAGVMKTEKVSWRVAPYGCRAVEISPDAVDPYTIVYMGDITLNKGAELFVPMMKVLRKECPAARMTVVGGGGDLSRLRKMISGSGLEDAFRLHGFVESFDEVLSILQKCAVAVAPYNPYDKNNFTFYSDPGKIKTYLGCGLPVVLTAVPPVAAILQKKGAGVIAEYSAEDFARKVCDILQGEKNPVNLMRTEAAELGREYTWEVIFTDSFKELFS
ncbi:MAG: glycosyltransferase [Kiritimatiellia bacterium]